jgi:hypothetical protein
LADVDLETLAENVEHALATKIWHLYGDSVS